MAKQNGTEELFIRVKSEMYPLEVEGLNSLIFDSAKKKESDVAEAVKYESCFFCSVR